MSKIIIVDEADNIITFKERADVLQPDIYRATALWITNSDGDILLAQRSFDKKHNPGKWGPAVSGTVEENETYEENVIKEAEEELGLSGIKLEKSIKKRVTGIYNHFTQWFTLQIDKKIYDFKIQKSEVEQIKWFREEELIKEIASHPEKFLKTMPGYVNNFVK